VQRPLLIPVSEAALLGLVTSSGAADDEKQNPGGEEDRAQEYQPSSHEWVPPTIRVAV
jgi:hypothetical protein